MELIHAKGSGFYGQNSITLMKTTTMVDVVSTQRRYEAAVRDAKTRYSNGKITLAKQKELIRQADFERSCLPVTKRIQSQQALDKVKIQPAGERQEQGYLVGINSADFEVGVENNNFEIKINKTQSMSLGIELGDYIFASGTEFGGIIDGRTIDTATDELIWSGTCWRGLLEHDIIRPLNAKTDPFRIVSGDLNTVLKTVLTENGGTGSFFSVPSRAAGKAVSKYQFPRYISKLKGLKNMLASVGYKLKIWADNAEPGGTFKVWCEAVPIVNYSQEIEYSQDTNRIDVKMTQDFSVCNHLICLGAGDLTERTVIDLYVDKSGKIVQTKPEKGFFGVYERISIYDYGAVEGETVEQKAENLLKSGMQHFTELNEVNAMELTVDDMPAEIGDIIAGRDRTTGMEMQEAITNKILRIDTRGTESIELSVNGKEVEEVEYN